MTIVGNFHEGSRAEYLAMYFLSKVGLVVPVPRQSDYFGVDFIVHLIKPQGPNLLPTGRSFAVQVKSNERPIAFSKDQLPCLWSMGIPFFVAVVSQSDLEFSLYPALARLNFLWLVGPDHPFSLSVGGAPEDLFARSWPNHQVKTGPAVVQLRPEEMEATSTAAGARQMFYEVMDAWLTFEEVSLSWRAQDIPIVENPKGYETNKAPDTDQRERRAYANPTTLPDICRAVEGPMFSLGFYLHDLIRRVEEGEIYVSPKLLEQAESLDRAVQAVKNGTRSLLRWYSPEKPI